MTDMGLEINYVISGSQKGRAVANIANLEACAGLTAVWLKNIFKHSEVLTKQDKVFANTLQRNGKPCKKTNHSALR